MTYSAGWPTKLANKSHGGIYGGWGGNAFRNDTAQCVPQAEFWRTLKSPVFKQECQLSYLETRLFEGVDSVSVRSHKEIPRYTNHAKSLRPPWGPLLVEPLPHLGL